MVSEISNQSSFPIFNRSSNMEMVTNENESRNDKIYENGMKMILLHIECF